MKVIFFSHLLKVDVNKRAILVSFSTVILARVFAILCQELVIASRFLSMLSKRCIFYIEIFKSLSCTEHSFVTDSITNRKRLGDFYFRMRLLFVKVNVKM